MPSSQARQVTPDSNGRVKLPELFALYERVLVLSAGRRTFWAELIETMNRSIQARTLRFRFVKEDPLYGLQHLSRTRTEYLSVSKCKNCRAPQTCARCLENVKTLAGIPHRQWRPYRIADSSTQTEDGEGRIKCNIMISVLSCCLLRYV